MTSQAEWWRGCVIYQIYPRSYQDSNADGIGDLKGITQRLPHIAKLGADAVWISPFFKSPMKDFGYDVADYCDIDPIFGTLDDAKTMLQTAHDLGLKVMIDMVWSHTSDQHDWFKQSRSNKDNDKHDWYVWADPKPDGTPPNNWLSYFGGPAWTWDARREQYYLHHFLKEQPTLNLWNKDVEHAIQQTAKFWLDMGVDGFRLDVAHAYLYDRQLRDNPPKQDSEPWPTDIPPSNPMARQRRVHQMCVPENISFIERLRSYVNQWPERCLLGEAGGDDSESVAASYVQTGKRFHLAYSFGLVGSEMRADTIRKAVNGIESRIKDGWICWATSNHDFKRAVSRYPDHAQHHDAAAKLNMALGLTLRGSYCLYQGEELGLPQAELTFAELRDPYDIMLYPEHVGRDGCRTPMPWDSTASHGGFTAANAQPWLPVKQPHLAIAVDTQDNNPHCVLALYRQFLQLRRASPALRLGDFEWSCATDPLLGYIRAYDGERILCLFNPSAETLSADILPAKYDVMLENAVTRSGKTINFSPFGFAVLRILSAQ